MANSDSDKTLLPSFDIALFPTGDLDSSFNLDHRNDPLYPWQRQQILQRKSAFNIQCTTLDVVHGKLGNGIRGLATLIVLKFWFDKRRLGRRIASADIEMKFSGMDPEADRPEVFAIAPHDRAALVETHLHRENTQEASIYASGTGQGVEVGGSYSWRKTESQDISDATTVTGSIDRVDDLYGAPNCASWTLLENETRHTGVPSTLQVAVLLKRETMDPFTCTVAVTAKADWRTALEWLVGSKSHEDPVLFKPSLPPTNRLRLYDIDNLSAIIREPLWDVGLIGPMKPDVKG